MHLRMRRRNNARVLFLLKRREDFNDHPSYSEQGISTGLLNSATFVQQMLLDSGIDTKLSVVLDNNCIDREVTEYRPTHVIIEALWVVPEKFEILRRLHPNVKWIIRFHSETPFIANEGVAMKWIHEYIKHPSVYIAINAPRFLTDVKTILAATGYTEAAINDNIIFLPNYYPLDKTVRAKELNRFCDTVNVCCFGAIRPLKNHLLQAIAALKFATVLGKKLNFHINVGRIEMKGDPILHNLQGLFDGLVKQGHQLTVHTWTSHDKFIEIIKNMDIGLQVSFTETFNIVAADMITSGVPIVVSNEIPWARVGIAIPTSTDDITRVMLQTYHNPTGNITSNLYGLECYIRATKDAWLSYF